MASVCKYFRFLSIPSICLSPVTSFSDFRPKLIESVFVQLTFCCNFQIFRELAHFILKMYSQIPNAVEFLLAFPLPVIRNVPTNYIIMNCNVSLPPALSAAIKNTAFKIETLPTAIMQTVKAGFISPPETWKTDMARVAMLSPLVNAMCITEFGVLFQVNPVPQARNRYKSVVKNSAKTSIQKKRESRSVFVPQWNVMLLYWCVNWFELERGI